MGKYALLIGINYRNTESELNGCVNDVANMKGFLLEHMSLSAENITILTEDQPTQPTKKNILNAIQQVIATINDRAVTHGEESDLWFHYSGHGSHVHDLSGDELDHQDEVLVPLDYAENDMITDDLMNELFHKLTDKCHVFCLFDCCHSGTMLDLQYHYNGSHTVTENRQAMTAQIAMISGCMDSQTSADAWIDRTWSGAMTWAFLKSIECMNYEGTYIQLLDHMRHHLKEAEYDQIPQLSASCADLGRIFKK